MIRVLVGDVRERLAELPDESVHCVATSPPYWGLRDYQIAGQLGLEPTLAEHLATMVDVFREVRRVLRRDGTVWLNYGDCYATSPNGRSAADTKATGNDDRTFRDKPFSTIGGALKAKDLCMIPNRLAIALQEDGWWVRSEIIWAKPNPMPESITDRPGTSHEKVFLLAKSARYFYDAAAVREATTGDVRAAQKMPDGWDTGPGGHGSFHRKGREKGKRGVPPRHAQYESSDRESLNDVGRGDRNLRNVWTIPIAGFSEAHFATFPPALVEPCIKAGTSERGVCPTCGAPWVRETEGSLRPTAKVSYGSRADSRDVAEASGNDQGSNRMRDGHIPGMTSHVETTGWSPSCQCDPRPPIPATVLDPFFGAGTTGLVADRLGRNCIGIELNPEYAALARRRLEADAGMFADVGAA